MLSTIINFSNIHMIYVFLTVIIIIIIRVVVSVFSIVIVSIAMLLITNTKILLSISIRFIITQYMLISLPSLYIRSIYVYNQSNR